MKYRNITFVFVLMLIVSTMMCKTVYADVPYNGYTYDAYGRAVPTAVCYKPDKYVTGLDMGAGVLKSPEDLFVSNDKKVYILDSGNNRVVVLDENFKAIKVIDKIFDESGKKYTLKNPSGIFVTDDNIIYIADTDNHVVISIDQNGKILTRYNKPTSQLFPQNAEFKPTKVIVDKARDVYAISDGVYQGAVMFDKSSNFTGFYGTNKVNVNAGILSDYFWKTFFMNKEQRRKTTRYVPTAFTNFYMDNEGFVYICSKYDTSSSNALKKINSIGTNILRTNNEFMGYGDLDSVSYAGNQIKTSFTDVGVDSEGFINVLDSTRGRIFQYDQDSNLVAVFGGKSNQVGTVNSPVAIESLNGKVLALDDKRGDITVYGLTEFGQWIHTAVKLYNDGLYEKSMAPWKEVLKRDNKTEIAYIGIGKGLLKTGDYKGAMKNFKRGYDVEDYSKAYGQYMASVVRKNIALIVGILILLYVSIAVYTRRKRMKAMKTYLKLEKKG